MCVSEAIDVFARALPAPSEISSEFQAAAVDLAFSLGGASQRVVAWRFSFKWLATFFFAHRENIF